MLYSLNPLNYNIYYVKNLKKGVDQGVVLSTYVLATSYKRELVKRGIKNNGIKNNGIAE